MTEKKHYKDYPKTIKLTTKWDNNDRPKMVPIKRWVSRDNECQPIVSYTKNTHYTNDIGFVLENLLVIDIDVGHAEGVNGGVSFRKWREEEHSKEEAAQIKADMLNTMNVATPSGGMHIYFSLPEGKTYDGSRSVGAKEGVDLLTGKNSYTPAPNSKRHDGMYKLVESSDGYIMEAPQWVIDLFDSAQEKTNVKSSSGLKSNSGMFNTNDGIYDTYFTIVREGFGKGERNDSMTRLCGKLINDMYKGNISEQNAMFVLEQTGANSSPPMPKSEIQQCWNSIYSKDTHRRKQEDTGLVERKKYR